MLCRFEVLVAEHPCQVLHRDVMGKGDGSKGMSGQMKSQILVQSCAALYKMQEIIAFLIADMRELVVVFNKDIHGGLIDGSEEVAARLQSVAVNVRQIPVPLCHGMEIKEHHVTEGQPSISGKDEQVTHPVLFRG